MKKTFLFASLVLMPFLAFAQTVQTKTEKINDEVTRTYSYYLNDKGEQVRHGKYTISWNVNKNDYKVKKRLDCNYKDGLLHGKLTYSCDWNVYKAYWSFTGSEDVVWKLENKMLDNFRGGGQMKQPSNVKLLMVFWRMILNSSFSSARGL